MTPSRPSRESRSEQLPEILPTTPRIVGEAVVSRIPGTFREKRSRIEERERGLRAARTGEKDRVGRFFRPDPAVVDPALAVVCDANSQRHRSFFGPGQPTQDPAAFVSLSDETGGRNAVRPPCVARRGEHDSRVFEDTGTPK